MPATVTLYQLRYDADRGVADQLRFPLIGSGIPADAPDRGAIESKARAANAGSLFDEGHYSKVAVVTVAADGLDALERAWTLTQNGVASDSWSRNPPPGVEPMPPGYIETPHGRFGYRSTDIGDIAELADGRRFAVDTFGFAPLMQTATSATTSVRIEEIEPGWEYRYRIIDGRDQYEEKAYTRERADELAVDLAARRLDIASGPTGP